MPRDEVTEPRHVRDARIVALARRRKSVRDIARQLGVPRSMVQEVVRRWRDPRYVRRRNDVEDDVDREFYAS
jgi:transposase